MKDKDVIDVAKLFGVHKTTMRRLWRAISERVHNFREEEAARSGGEYHNISVDHLITDLSFYQPGSKDRGRKPKWDRAELKEVVKELPLKERRNWKSLASSTGVPRATLQYMMKQGTFRRHSSSLKPRLTEENMLARVDHALGEIHLGTVRGGRREGTFKDMMDRVDVDEKWFYLTYDGENYILVDDSDGNEGDKENDPIRRTRHKGYITKVLFLCAVARPRWDTAANKMWDGKIGIWPVGEMTPAQRTSQRRVAGTMVWNDHPVTKDKYRELLLTCVVPAIAEKWPRGAWASPKTIIRIQQDGPQTHIAADDELFEKGLEELGLENKIVLYTQPANSPDCNINDLGFFRALEADYRRYSPRDETQIIEYVTKSYWDFCPKKINHVWLSLMAVYNQIIDHHGDNNFKIPHLNKVRLERQGELPHVLPITETAYEYLALN